MMKVHRHFAIILCWLILPGGFLNDWKLSTNLEGLFVAGDSLYASNCYGHAGSKPYSN